MSCLSRSSEAEMLGLPDLDADTQHALFPNLPTADAASRGLRWKWSDIGAAPALHHSVQHAQHATAAVTYSRHEQDEHAQEERRTASKMAPSTAKQQAGCERHKSVDRKALNQGRSAPTSRRASPTGIHTRSPSCSPHPGHYLVSLRWGAQGAPPLPPQAPTPQHNPACLSSGTPQSPSSPGFFTYASHPHHASQITNSEDPTAKMGLSQQPHRSQLQHSSSPSEGLLADDLEAWFRSASPSVARACVTLPGFCPPAKARRMTQAGATEGAQTGEQYKPAAELPAGEHALYFVHKTFH